MEKFWNTIYYFAYKIDGRLSFYFLKYTGVFYIYDIPIIKRRLKNRFKIDKPVKCLVNFNARPDIGLNSIFATYVMQSIPFVFLFGLHNFYFLIFNSSWIPSFEIYIYPLVVYGLISGLLNYFLLFRKDKYLKYFKQVEKQPHRWKVKWAWISAGVILFPFLVLISSFIVMAH